MKIDMQNAFKYNRITITERCINNIEKRGHAIKELEGEDTS